MDENDENPGVLVAGVVYALMNQGYHVSRNVRTQWFFKHLNKKIILQPITDITQDCEIQILSVYPQDAPIGWGPETSLSYQYLITPSTNVVYLSKVNKAVYCLDLSPSISAVDIQHGEVMLDEIVSAVKQSIEGVVKPFYVPGTDILFEPDLFVTVIVHTPFFTTPAQQVLVQGWRVTAENVDEFLSAIIKQLELLEDTIADVSALVHDEIESLRQKQAESERLVGGLFEEVNEKQPGLPPGISMVSPDSGFINLLRYGMLALRLLPSSNLSNLIVVTDGMITLPDIHVVDSVLTQLRSNAVAVSFLHVGSQFHPHSCHGLVPYSELMQFIASATLGAYIPSPCSYAQNKSINIYQEAFITWNFRRKKTIQELSTPIPQHGDWNICNSGFYGNREPQLLIKKQSEDHLNAGLTSILCCRLHEGYMIKNVHLRGNDLEVTMMLPWSNHIYLEYVINSEWPPIGTKNLVHFILSIKAPYEFLHDITCPMKKPFQSPYRQAVVSRFWCTLKTLSHTDILLSHLDSFADNAMAYTIPDSIRNGMPLFYLPTNSSPPELSSSGSSCPQFAQFWRPIVLLEPSVWQKWLHTHRIGLILQPDRPLPNSLHTMANNPRVHVLQCRQAEAALYCSLKKLTTFVLIENHSYIKIMPSVDYDKGPNWFYIVRVTSKPPCAVIHIAFLGGTPGNLRHQVVETIKEEISNLKIPQRVDLMRKYDPLDIQLRSEVECCTIIQKPLEKILIRYERMPCEFGTVVFPDGTQPISAAKPLKPSSTLITTLSRYLHHKRSIWDAHTPSASHNNMLPTMLTTLTRMRLQEGFRFAHCSAGIINMILEVQMKCFEDECPSANAGQIQPCIIQYVLFPPHMTTSSMKGSNSGDEANDELENEQRIELITECWIEPQHGVVTGSPSYRSYMENLHYHQIADIIWRVDAECISNLLTFDHLQLMCHNQQIVPPLALDPSSLHHNPLENWPHAVAIEDKRIHRIPFAYNLLNLLPKCQQAELLSCVFVQELSDVWNCKSRTDAPNNLLMDNLLSQLQDLHHRELHLTDHESSQFLQLILKRFRDVGKHPVPFPSGNNKLNGRKVSDTESTDTCETVPAASDWARMISWATYSTEVTTPLQGSMDDIKGSKPSSKTTLWECKKSKMPAKWRCFVKSMASTHCVLTFIPASFQDLKILMLGYDEKMYTLYDFSDKKLNDLKEYDTKIRPESVSNHESEIFQNTPSVSDVDYSDLISFSKASSKVDLQFSEEDLVFESTVSSKKGNLKEKLEPFRLRSSSWDPMKKNPEILKADHKRVRTSSVGAKMKPISFQKRLLESSENEYVKSSISKEEKSKPVYGALTLPIYVYDCPLSNLVDALIFKSSFERKNDIFQDKSVKAELEHPIVKNDSDNTPDDLDLKHHCKVITQAFNKAFVEALFKSLHSNHKICSADIQSAVEECEETLLEIDITKYIQTVCGHYKGLIKGEAPTINPSQISPSTCLAVELFPLHKLIKQRFLEILTVCFKSVPTSPEYFFCCPPVQISRMADVGLDISNHRGEAQEFDLMTLQSDPVEFSSNHNSMIGGWDRLAFESTQDDARTSLLSNMDSDSVSDYLNDAGDELFPLFLHLVCSIRLQNKTVLTENPVKIIPTCLGELLGDVKRLDPLDLNKITVTLDMYCLTLPPAYPADLPPGDMTNHQDTHGPSLSHSEQLQSTDQHFINDGIKSNDKLQHLPTQQNKAVNKCIVEIEWFLQDEIAVFLLDSCPINETTLNLIANHVISSDGRRYSCIQNTVGLNFVFGPEHSLEKFIQEFAQLRIPGYCLKRDSDYYYLVKSQEAGDNQRLFYTFGESFGPHALFDEYRNYCSSAKNLCEMKNEWTEMDRKAFYTNLSFRWIQELNTCRTSMPNFWLILKIDEDKVTCYFHCRFLEIDTEEVQQYKYIHQNVLESIESVCKIVNQRLLLNSLHETRMCDILLEPETPEDCWKPSQLLNKTIDDSTDIDLRGNYTDTSQKFHPGAFSCPVVWQTNFTLHPRLKTGPGKPGLSRAIQALRTVLNRFSVNNRTNMFVYQDNSGSNVFYLRLHENVRNSAKIGTEDENSPGSVSRSSSINSLTNKKQHEEFAKEMRPRLKSLGESIDSLASRHEDFLTLKVHGISPAGAEIKNELVQVLQNRLDDAVLEVVSVMLARNPMCKLSPDDVHFIQKPYHKADSIIQFTIPEYAHQSVDSLTFYIRQNLSQFWFLPKYTDNRVQFQDYSEPEGSPKRISENNIYLYNQSPVSGNKGIACLAVSLVDSRGNNISEGECNPPISTTCGSQPLHPNMFHKVTSTDVYKPAFDGAESPNILMEVRLWKQGRVNMEILIQKLKGIIQFSLWDLLTEYHLLNTPIKEKSMSGDKEIEMMNPFFYKEIPSWLQYGNELNVPAVKSHTINLSTRHAVSITLREINNLIQLHEPSTHIFYENIEKTGAIAFTGEYEIPSISTCYLVSSNAPIYTNPNDAESIGSMDNDLRNPVTIQKLPIFASPTQDMIQCMPRHRFLISLITNEQVIVYMYNWSKDKVENLTKMLTQLGSWLSARSNFLIGILSQKMGIFHNQPWIRKSTPQLTYIDGSELECLLNFTPNSTPRKIPSTNMASVTQILRDADPIIFKKCCADPVVSSIHQVIDIRSNDKRDQHDKLHLMWQSRGVTPYIPILEDTLELFLTYARSIHYCLTPLLFHPKWRLESAATRDYSLHINSSSLNITDYISDYRWHQSMCSNFISEYKQYLQTLGYIPVQTAPNTPKKIGKCHKTDDDTKYYLQKSTLGGIIMLEICLFEPFFQAKLHAIEYSRLQAKPTTSWLSQILLNFLGECDNVKILIHLHSFTYDYHLRCLESYILGQHSPLTVDYHLTSFLDDFLKYYPKAPNFARCLASSGTLCISHLSTPSLQLFHYLLSHEKDYGMEVLRMLPQELVSEADYSSRKNEFILVKQSLPVKEDLGDGKPSEFRVTYIVAFEKSSAKTAIKLNYYVILTSGRDLYPKAEVEWKLGKFCTVSTANNMYFSKLTKADSVETLSEVIKTSECDSEGRTDDPLIIRQESVNYLGYYSAYEQLMQQLMETESSKVQNHIEMMVTKGSVDCRIHLLWNKLLSNPPNNSLTYTELFELKDLAHIQTLLDVDKRLNPILMQPFSWYQGLMKILLSKYAEKCKIFVSPDNNVQHLLILHPRFLNGFVMLTLDSANYFGELNIIFRNPCGNDVIAEDMHNLIEGVINASCYHLWITLIT